MKLLINILLLVITAAYTLPVNELLSKESVSCLNDKEESKVKESKTEKVKEIVAANILLTTVFNPIINILPLQSINKIQFLHQVETPPPDFI